MTQAKHHHSAPPASSPITELLFLCVGGVRGCITDLSLLYPSTFLHCAHCHGFWEPSFPFPSVCSPLLPGMCCSAICSSLGRSSLAARLFLGSSCIASLSCCYGGQTGGLIAAVGNKERERRVTCRGSSEQCLAAVPVPVSVGCGVTAGTPGRSGEGAEAGAQCSVSLAFGGCCVWSVWKGPCCPGGGGHCHEPRPCKKLLI